MKKSYGTVSRPDLTKEKSNGKIKKVCIKSQKLKKKGLSWLNNPTRRRNQRNMNAWRMKAGASPIHYKVKLLMETQRSHCLQQIGSWWSQKSPKELQRPWINRYFEQITLLETEYRKQKSRECDWYRMGACLEMKLMDKLRK